MKNYFPSDPVKQEMLGRIIQLVFYGPFDIRRVKKEIEKWTGKTIEEVLKDE